MQTMDVKEYRRQYEAELAAAAEAPAQPIGMAVVRAGAGAGSVLSLSATQMAQRTLLSGQTLGDSVPALLATLRNQALPVETRDAALQALGAAAFLGEHFAPFRAEFLATMRELAQTESTPSALREKAIGVLAAEKDPNVQEILRRGLRDPRAALVPAAEALHLLSLDDHASIAPLAREVFDGASDLATQEAALRVLASDPGSQDLLARILADKAQPRSLRALSATGLHSLNPQLFGRIARDIITDSSDFEDIRATSLGALASAPEHQALRDDPGFRAQVKELSTQAPLANLRAAADRLLSK
jgi:hypothetical protein